MYKVIEKRVEIIGKGKNRRREMILDFFILAKENNYNNLVHYEPPNEIQFEIYEPKQTIFCLK